MLALKLMITFLVLSFLSGAVGQVTRNPLSKYTHVNIDPWYCNLAYVCFMLFGLAALVSGLVGLWIS